jgi:hypothetical protein
MSAQLYFGIKTRFRKIGFIPKVLKFNLKVLYT